MCDLHAFFASGKTAHRVSQPAANLQLNVELQILDNQAYIVGETKGYHDLKMRNKRMLASVMAANLPNVDFVIQGSDWLPKARNSSGGSSRLSCMTMHSHMTGLRSYQSDAQMICLPFQYQISTDR